MKTNTYRMSFQMHIRNMSSKLWFSYWYFHTLTYVFIFSNIYVMELKGMHFQCKTVLHWHLMNPMRIQYFVALHHPPFVSLFWNKLCDLEKSWPLIDIVQPLNSYVFMYNNFSLMEVHYWCKTILHRHPMTIDHSQF